MSRRYIDWDPNTGIAHFVDTDETTGITTFGVAQDVDVIVEENVREYNSDHPHRHGNMTRVGRIPMAMLQEWQASGMAQDDRAIRKFLNNADNRKWRTRPGTV